MNKDPYMVLGVSKDATNDEIKKVYRQLCRKYHPDANMDNPKEAEEKFKEVGEAYRTIMDIRSGKTTDFSKSTADNITDSRLRAAAVYIQRGYFREAANTLNSIEEKNALWYYLSAIVNVNLGNVIMAREYAKTAVGMDPGNSMYQNLYSRLSGEGGFYQEYRTFGEGYGRSVNLDMNYCVKCCAANMVLQMCCGIRCCYC